MKHDTLNERITHAEAKGKSARVVSHHTVRDNRGTTLRFTWNSYGGSSTPYSTANLALWNKQVGGGWCALVERSAEECRHIPADGAAPIDMKLVGELRDSMLSEAGALLSAVLVGDSVKPHRG